MLFSGGNRLRKGVDVLVGNFLGDETLEQTCGELRILWFFGNEGSGGLNRQQIQFLCRCSVEESANRITGDANGIHRMEAGAAALHGAHNLVYVRGFQRALSLANLYLQAAGRDEKWNGLGSTNLNGSCHECP